jgi:hypothetical protein
MKYTSLFALTVALGLPATLGAAPAGGGSSQAVLLASMAARSSSASDRDRAIRRAYEDILHRKPSDIELRHYRELMEDDDWTEDDVRDDLREERDHDGGDRGHRSGHRSEDPDRIVRRAYEDILDREPDSAGLRLYRSRIVDDDWTEDDVRKALRESPEYRTHREQRADKIVRDAYQDVLGRAPDAAGLRTYKDHVLRDDWDERQVRDALRKSPEYRQKGTMTRAQAEEIVKRAYQEVLGRDPDAGSRGYIDRILRDHWTQEDVARELRKSPEYRNKH